VPAFIQRQKKNPGTSVAAAENPQHPPACPRAAHTHKKIHPQALNHFYGYALPIPPHPPPTGLKAFPANKVKQKVVPKQMQHIFYQYGIKGIKISCIARWVLRTLSRFPCPCFAFICKLLCSC
jgi:hypothetical protein